MSEETVKKQVTAKKNTVEKTVSGKKEAVLIYVGPTNTLLTRYTAYRGGYPVHVTDHLKELPLLKKLFVLKQNFIEFEKNLNTEGSAESIWFTQVNEYFKKVVAK